MDHIEAKREEARQHRGVWYDARADKFVGEIYSKGSRHFLGHFATAGEAADAYVAARAELPSGRGGDGSFVNAFQSFLNDCESDADGTPKAGELMTYKDQDFTFEGVVFRSMKGRKRPFYEWISSCSVCGDPYVTMTATTPGVAKGITRNCEQHRKGAKPAAVRVEPDAPDVPEQWTDVAYATLEALSLVGDSFDPETFCDQCMAIAPDLPRKFTRYLMEHPKSPVILRDGMFFPRDV